MNASSLTPFNGSDYQHDRDAPRLTEQTQRVFDRLSDHQWHSLEEIAAETGDPTPSVSAQIRHLRKARFGSHEIEKRHAGNGLYHYRLTGEKAESVSEPLADSTPLPPAAPELLEIAHKELGQMKTELETERAKVAILTSALDSIIRSQPAGSSNGECFYEHFDGDGNYLGAQHVDPLQVIHSMVEDAYRGLSSAAKLDPQISSENP